MPIRSHTTPAHRNHSPDATAIAPEHHDAGEAHERVDARMRAPDQPMHHAPPVEREERQQVEQVDREEHPPGAPEDVGGHARREQQERRAEHDAGHRGPRAARFSSSAIDARSLCPVVAPPKKGTKKMRASWYPRTRIAAQ
ncbi:hypothetical protein [Sandaracinus amylolyticus]|uniref:hypothetical protein n=1 Tax=Sandaracinus amylolyticus TaxID=927083 RepID=UPI001F36E584|nr:hypothetical protein [Sandaracinus amylolyticus]